MMLVLIVIVLAIAGGFLGTLLEIAAWAIGILAVVGAILGFLAYRWYEGLKSRVSGRS